MIPVLNLIYSDSLRGGLKIGHTLIPCMFVATSSAFLLRQRSAVAAAGGKEVDETELYTVYQTARGYLGTQHIVTE